MLSPLSDWILSKKYLNEGILIDKDIKKCDKV